MDNLCEYFSIVQGMVIWIHNTYYLQLVIYKKFMSTLESVHGGIYGAATLPMLFPNHPRLTQPFINIAVPLGGTDPVSVMLASEGYSAKTVSIDVCWSKFYARVTHLSRDHGKTIIIINESCCSSLIPVILGACTTASMNLLTPRNLYSLYPQFTATYRALSGYHQATPLLAQVNERYGVNLLCPRDLVISGRTCGFECPSITRRLRGLFGVGVFCWNAEGKEDDDVTQDRYTWTLGEECPNTRCPFR